MGLWEVWRTQTINLIDRLLLTLNNELLPNQIVERLLTRNQPIFFFLLFFFSMFKSYLRLSNSSLRLYSTKTLVKFENAQVHRFGAKEPAFRNLSLRLTSDDRLVIVGPVSAGKSTLAETIAGKHVIRPSSAASWPIIDPSVSPYPSDHIHLVSFKENSGSFNYSQHYYQERFNFRSLSFVFHD